MKVIVSKGLGSKGKCREKPGQVAGTRQGCKRAGPRDRRATVPRARCCRPFKNAGFASPRIDVSDIEVYMNASMQCKRNQVEEAIFRTLGARDARVDALKFRLKRLLVTDRRLGCVPNSDEQEDHHYAFYSGDPPGSGTEVRFSAYEAFALLAAIMLLEHGLPQASVVKVMRQVRRRLEAAHAQTLKKDPAQLFDPQALPRPEPGMIVINNTHPVFLVLVGLTESSVGDQKGGTAVGVCQGREEFAGFMRKHLVLGAGATFFELVGLMHTLAGNLLQVPPSKRGRGAT
jgi:hypothetical protein